MRENKHSLDRESDDTRSRLDSVGPFLDAHLLDACYECGGFDAQQLRFRTVQLGACNFNEVRRQQGDVFDALAE